MRISTAIVSLACGALGLINAAVINFPMKNRPATVVQCPNETPLLNITSYTINPNPPKRGNKLTIEGTGTLTKDIVEGATIDVIVKLGLIKLLTKQFNFCEESSKINLACPVAAGEQSIKAEVDLPKEIPLGQFTANIKINNPGATAGEKGDLVSCIIAKADFRFLS